MAVDTSRRSSLPFLEMPPVTEFMNTHHLLQPSEAMKRKKVSMEIPSTKRPKMDPIPPTLQPQVSSILSQAFLFKKPPTLYSSTNHSHARMFSQHWNTKWSQEVTATQPKGKYYSFLPTTTKLAFEPVELELDSLKVGPWKPSGDIQKLTTDNGDLSEHLAALEAENRSLKEQVMELTNMVKKAGSGLGDLVKGYSKQTSNLSAGVCLMIILFSFGAFLEQYPHSKLLPNKNSATSSRSRGIGRRLLSFDDAEPTVNSLSASSLYPGGTDESSTLFICDEPLPSSNSSNSNLAFLVSPEILVQLLQQKKLAGTTELPTEVPCSVQEM